MMDPDIFLRREADWRCGCVVYQVLVDRFAPSMDLESKRDLYAHPRRLRAWDELPLRGEKLEDYGVWSHELDFWGGDLQSVRDRLSHLSELGVDVLYLNPIHEAFTNHKYDASDYAAVSREYGSREDVKLLVNALHARGMRLVLDGVFNHMGIQSPAFREALRDPASPWRNWFYLGEQYRLGYRAWYDVPNLPEVNHEHAEVRKRIFEAEDSVIQGYLRDGVDGWRLDVAYDLGFDLLHQITQAAHRARPDSVVIGEIWNYPEAWFPSIDGIMNMYARKVILHMVEGAISASHAGVLLARMVEDAGIEPMLRSWMILENHDTPRWRTLIGDRSLERVAQVLQFTLPGCPNLYYGVEAGMEGGADPENRAPMRWDDLHEEHDDWRWINALISMRKKLRALRIGDVRFIDTETVMAFARRTDRADDYTLVVVHAGNTAVMEPISVRDSKVMSPSRLRDVLSNEEFLVESGMVHVPMPPRSVRVLHLEVPDTHEYSAYKRVC